MERWELFYYLEIHQALPVKRIVHARFDAVSDDDAMRVAVEFLKRAVWHTTVGVYLRSEKKMDRHAIICEDEDMLDVGHLVILEKYKMMDMKLAKSNLYVWTKGHCEDDEQGKRIGALSVSLPPNIQTISDLGLVNVIDLKKGENFQVMFETFVGMGKEMIKPNPVVNSRVVCWTNRVIGFCMAKGWQVPHVRRRGGEEESYDVVWDGRISLNVSSTRIYITNPGNILGYSDITKGSGTDDEVVRMIIALVKPSTENHSTITGQTSLYWTYHAPAFQYKA